MGLEKYIRESLREIVLGDDVLVESKSVGDWWDKLPGKRREKVLDILGMNKGKDTRIFDKLDPEDQSEISAYFKKYKGKVEGVDDDGKSIVEMSMNKEFADKYMPGEYISRASDKADFSAMMKAIRVGPKVFDVEMDKEAGTVTVTLKKNGKRVFMGLQKGRGGPWIVRYHEKLFSVA